MYVWIGRGKRERDVRYVLRWRQWLGAENLCNVGATSGYFWIVSEIRSMLGDLLDLLINRRRGIEGIAYEEYRVLGRSSKRSYHV